MHLERNLFKRGSAASTRIDLAAPNSFPEIHQGGGGLDRGQIEDKDGTEEIMNRCFATVFGLAALMPHSQAFADYPDRSVRLVVPYTPGGTVDILARSLAERMTKAWNQPVVIENRPGAGGSIGAEAVAKAVPDGYTLFISTSSPLTINVWLQKNLRYDPLRDFTPITAAGENSLVLVTNPSVPATNIRQLIDYVKTKPVGELSAGTSGQGTTAHLSLAQFNKLAGVEVTHVPYRGGVPSLTAAVANEVPMTFSDIVPAMPLVRGDKLRALATTGPRRAGIAPDIPTMIEAGLPGFDIVTWIGLVAPNGTPRNIVFKIYSEVAGAVKDPAFRERMIGMGIDPLSMPPDEFSEFLRKEVPRWKGIVDGAGLQPE
jgi:tripartite-type tricarboxylate transporter receptor subunit TctC